MSSFKRSQLFGLHDKVIALGEKKLIAFMEDNGFKVTPKCNRIPEEKLISSEYRETLEYWNLPIRFDDDWNKKKGAITDSWQYAVNAGYNGFFNGERSDTIYSNKRIDLFPVAGNSYADGHFLVEAFRVLRARPDVEMVFSLLCKLDDNANSILTTVPSDKEKEFVIKEKKMLNQILALLKQPEETYEFKEENYRVQPPETLQVEPMSKKRQGGKGSTRTKRNTSKTNTGKTKKK